MKRRKIILYHPSDTKFDIVKIKYFDKHYYTKAENRSSSVKRTFWYFELPIPERRFRNSPYIYITEIDKRKLYNLKTDKKKLIDKFDNIHSLLLYLKKHYKGAYYKPNGYDIACIFYNVKPIQIIENN